jgi:hypothetical protein
MLIKLDWLQSGHHRLPTQCNTSACFWIEPKKYGTLDLFSYLCQFKFLFDKFSKVQSVGIWNTGKIEKRVYVYIFSEDRITLDKLFKIEKKINDEVFGFECVMF